MTTCILAPTCCPTQVSSTNDGRIFFLLPDEKGQEILCQWIIRLQPKQDFRIRLTPVYTADAPNRKGLEQCRQRAAFIEEKYGLSVLFHTPSVRFVPEGYTILPEHITPILSDVLDRAERALLRLPTELIKETVQGIQSHDRPQNSDALGCI